MGDPIFTTSGICPVCDQRSDFQAYSEQLRNSYICRKCHSLPRHRAFAHTVNSYFPNWEVLKTHEANPGVSTAIAKRFSNRIRDYTVSRYKPGMAPGEVDIEGTWQHQDLEAQSFPNECFDLVFTQDVFEHVFHPDKAIREIARTLRPGGAHICTVPLTQGASKPSRRRARLGDHGKVDHLVAEPEYHGNPIDDQGSLVTFDWGYDIADYFDYHSGLNTTIIMMDRDDIGVKGTLSEVLVSTKRSMRFSKN